MLEKLCGREVNKVNRKLLLLVFLVVSDCSPIPFQIYLRKVFGRKQQISWIMSEGLGLKASEVCLVSEGTSYYEH